MMKRRRPTLAELVEDLIVLSEKPAPPPPPRIDRRVKRAMEDKR